MFEKIFDLSFRCLICNKKISTGFYYCNDCAIKYGMSDKQGKFKRPLEWEDWARDRYNWGRRERRRIKKMNETWVEFCDGIIHKIKKGGANYDEIIYREEEPTKEKLIE